MKETSKDRSVAWKAEAAVPPGFARQLKYYRSQICESRERLGATGIASLAALGMLSACSGTATSQGNSIQAHQAALTTDSGPSPMGFESPSYWQVTQGSVRALQSSAQRTSGAAALAVVGPSGYARIDSTALSSTSPALAGLATGAKAAIDINIPAQQANPYWFGAVQMYVNSPSRNIYNGYLGQVELTGMRTGSYQTIRFAFPDYVVSALTGASFADLTFGIVINVPQNSPGTYLLDNLRLKSSVLPPAPTQPSTGEWQVPEGQSTTLVAWKSMTAGVADQVAQATFTQSLAQVPQSLHVVKGAAGGGTATLVLGLTGSTATTCTFQGDSAGANYVLVSCTGGAKAGDLLPADSVTLTVNTADANSPKTKIQAQIALNPAGDDIVQGLPPIPTYLGSSAAEMAAALDSFALAQKSWQLGDNVAVHLPTPELNLHDSETTNDDIPAPQPGDTDPPFKKTVNLTNSDMADARWHLNGSIDANTDSAGTRHTHFDNTVGTDIYILGAKINLMSISATVDASSPAPSLGGGTGTSTAKYCYSYILQTEQCKNASGNIAAPIDLFRDSPSITFIDFTWWIFHVGASGGLDIYATVQGDVTPNGLAITLTPGAALWFKVEAGVAVGFAGGGLWGQIDLFRVQIPITVGASIVTNVDPRVCTQTVSESLSAQLQFSALGGKLGYYLEGGLTCGWWGGLCWRDDETIFPWDGLKANYNIIPATPLVNQTTPLPHATCAVPGDAPGKVDYPVDSELFPQGTTSFLTGEFSRRIPQDPPSVPPVVMDTPFDCKTFTWFSSDPSDVITAVPGQAIGCTPQIVYGNPGTRTITVVASDPALGNGSASVQVTVSPALPNPPIPTITSIGGCNGQAQGTATDPLAQDLTLSWYEEPGDHAVGTGTTSGNLGGGFSGALRLAASAPDGRVGVVESPLLVFCEPK